MKQFFFVLVILALFIFNGIEVFGQNVAPYLPQRGGSITSTQTLHFGDLTVRPGSAGGTVTVNYNGTRSAIGDVSLLNFGYTARQAIFEFKLCPGRTVTVTYPSISILTGTNGGSLTLHVGSTNYGNSGCQFTSNKGCDDVHLIYVGGTIDVGAITSNPPGLYTGTFDLIFVQE